MFFFVLRLQMYMYLFHFQKRPLQCFNSQRNRLADNGISCARPMIGPKKDHTIFIFAFRLGIQNKSTAYLARNQDNASKLGNIHQRTFGSASWHNPIQRVKKTCHHLNLIKQLDHLTSNNNQSQVWIQGRGAHRTPPPLKLEKI